MYSNYLVYSASLPAFDVSQYEFICNQTVAENIRSAVVSGEKGELSGLSYVTIEHKVCLSDSYCTQWCILLV